MNKIDMIDLTTAPKQNTQQEPISKAATKKAASTKLKKSASVRTSSKTKVKDGRGRPRNSSASKSRSRSNSRSRVNKKTATATATLGAKVVTKKEQLAATKKAEQEAARLAQVQSTLTDLLEIEKKPARRSMRSSSSQSQSSVISSVEPLVDISAAGVTSAAKITSKRTSRSSLLADVKEQESSSISVEKSESESSSSEQPAKRSYGLRQRKSPSVPLVIEEQQAQQNEAPPQEEVEVPKAGCPLNVCGIFNRAFDSGYLRFTIKQLIHILVASLALVIVLGFINHFHLLDTSYDLVRNGPRQLWATLQRLARMRRAWIVSTAQKISSALDSART